MSEFPKISVIMGIFNCEQTLSEAITCIFAQTYSNWELILCDDGSTDSTAMIAQKYAQMYPHKIVLLKNAQNLGLNETLNRCLQFAKGEYIAKIVGLKDMTGSAM